MTRIISLLIIALFSVGAIAGCEANVYGTNNSSLGDNDYFEEPISERSKKYTGVLETSNKFIESFANGQLDDAYELLDPRLQDVVSVQKFEQMHETIRTDFGPLVEYKPMQWGFSTNSKLKNTVVSIKIVIHERSETFYILNFEDNGKYQRIIGFNITPRASGERVVSAAGRAHGLN
jgi:hypothetical protein